MRSFKILIGAACLALPLPLLAQQVPPEIAASVATLAQDGDDDDGNPRLGLLGLLGLAGLLGLFRPGQNIHVDARREPRQ